jgi:hypothetical protein
VSAGGAHPESPPGDLATEAQRLEVEEPGGPLDVQQIAIRRLADPLKLRPGRRPPGQLADQGVGEALGDAEQGHDVAAQVIDHLDGRGTRRRKKTPPMPMNGSQ